VIKIILHKNSKGVKILAPIFRGEFNRLGFKSRIIITDDLYAISRGSRDIFFVFTPHKFTNFKRTNENSEAVFIMYQQEQLSFKTKVGKMRINQLKSFIEYYDYIVDISRFNNQVYKIFRRKVDFFLPTAYHKKFEINAQIKKNHSYDIIFFGRYKDKPRRIRILKYLCKHSNFYPKFEGLYGQELNRAIVHSEFILNIHQNNDQFPEWLRIMIAVSNKKLLITEPITHIKPLRKNRDFVESSWSEMPMVIDEYLKNKKKCIKITNSAYYNVKKNYRLDYFLGEFTKKILKPLCQ
jgi:hypothetical protein